MVEQLLPNKNKIAILFNSDSDRASKPGLIPCGVARAEQSSLFLGSMEKNMSGSTATVRASRVVL
jgi:hypothetical protein